MKQLSANFHEKEFACKGTGQVKVSPLLIEYLETLRAKLKASITITSGYRSPEYNKKIGGAPKSQHLLGTAADIQVKGYTPEEVAKVAETIGFGGIGIYDTFTHVDVRGAKARWDLRTKKPEPVKVEPIKEVENMVKVVLEGKEIGEGKIIDGTTYLPVRALAEALNLAVAWNAKTKTVSIAKK